MKTFKSRFLWLLLVSMGILVIAAIAVIGSKRNDQVSESKSSSLSLRIREGAAGKAKSKHQAVRPSANAGGVDSAEEEGNVDDAEVEKNIAEFDKITDKWLKPSKKAISTEELGEFADAFKKIPPQKRIGCVHRALNLIPDENVLLLAGLLMDKGLENEVVETIYNDILNRDELVKKPILLEIFKDKTHPCWADTAWILDVTGELPKKN